MCSDPKCEYFDEGKMDCDSVQKEEPHLFCTRKKGHKGPHAGCGFMEESHPIKTWENENDSNPQNG